jgi:hypothetical protein
MLDRILLPAWKEERFSLGGHVLHLVGFRRLPRRRRVPRDVLRDLKHDGEGHDLEFSVICLGARKWELLRRLRTGELQTVVVGWCCAVQRCGDATDGGRGSFIVIRRRGRRRRPRRHQREHLFQCFCIRGLYPKRSPQVCTQKSAVKLEYRKIQRIYSPLTASSICPIILLALARL